MIRLAGLSDFDQIYSIMEQSFPKDEYRSYEVQKDLFLDSTYSVFADFTADGAVTAFAAVWNLGDFLFVEHLACTPARRNQGLGSALLQYLANSFGKMLCLEVELPISQLNKRRIAFYKRNGFCLNSFPYMQPSLSPESKPVPLLIMTSGKDITEAEFLDIRDRLYSFVYQVK